MSPRLILLYATCLGWLLTTGCARHRASKAPIVETVRTPESPTPPTAARDLADVMASNLNLKPEQTVRVRSILNGTVEQVNAARQKYAPNSPQLKTELSRINTASQNQLRQVLGPVAFKQLQVKQKQIQAEMQQRQK